MPTGGLCAGDSEPPEDDFEATSRAWAQALGVDADTTEVPTGGADAAKRRLESFLDTGAAKYAKQRDLPAVDRAALAGTVVRVSEFLADHAGHVAELDIDPVICRAGEITAVDALIIPAT